MVKAMNRLTPRERDIARLVGTGLSNKGVARRLGVAEGTVKIHVHNILAKLELTNRVTLAMFVQEQVSRASVVPPVPPILFADSLFAAELFQRAA
jgi:DNA-binding NarL/FixJ family response regulator